MAGKILRELTHDEVANRNDIVGGDLQVEEAGRLCRGPIEAIITEKRREWPGWYILRFKTPWTAINCWNFERRQTIWKKVEFPDCNLFGVSSNAEFKWTEWDDGRLVFHDRVGLQATIFTTGSNNKLNPAEVEGL